MARKRKKREEEVIVVNLSAIEETLDLDQETNVPEIALETDTIDQGVTQDLGPEIVEIEEKILEAALVREEPQEGMKGADLEINIAVATLEKDQEIEETATEEIGLTEKENFPSS